MTGPTAADLVNELPEKELADLIFEYGQETKSRRIAAAIVRARSRAPIVGTDELAGIVVGAVGRRPGGPHPARRTFQALRIAVNREIEELAASLPQAVDLLAPGGRVVVLAYHSLEDRIVKQTFRDDGRLSILTKKPLRPSQAEIGREPPRPQREAPRRRTRGGGRVSVPAREVADEPDRAPDPICRLPVGAGAARPADSPDISAPPARTPAARPQADRASRRASRARRGLHPTFLVFASIVIVRAGDRGRGHERAVRADGVRGPRDAVAGHGAGGAARRARQRGGAAVVAQPDRRVGRALPDGDARQRGHPAGAAVRASSRRRPREGSRPGGVSSRCSR